MNPQGDFIILSWKFIRRDESNVSGRVEFYRGIIELGSGYLHTLCVWFSCQWRAEAESWPSPGRLTGRRAGGSSHLQPGPAE
jgi:hypothetical protein